MSSAHRVCYVLVCSRQPTLMTDNLYTFFVWFLSGNPVSHILNNQWEETWGGDGYHHDIPQDHKKDRLDTVHDKNMLDWSRPGPPTTAFSIDGYQGGSATGAKSNIKLPSDKIAIATLTLTDSSVAPWQCCQRAGGRMDSSGQLWHKGRVKTKRIVVTEFIPLGNGINRKVDYTKEFTPLGEKKEWGFIPKTVRKRSDFSQAWVYLLLTKFAIQVCCYRTDLSTASGMMFSARCADGVTSLNTCCTSHRTVSAFPLTDVWLAVGKFCISFWKVDKMPSSTLKRT